MVRPLRDEKESRLRILAHVGDFVWLRNVPIPRAQRHSTASVRDDYLSKKLKLILAMAGGALGNSATVGCVTPAAAL